MKKRTPTLAVLTLLALGTQAGWICGAKADEFALKLKPGPGSDLTQANCSACHSLDYVLTNSPFLTKAAWDGEVNKMIKAFGADIQPADAKQIIEYLGCNYGS